ncbi:DUF2225 domain-containing protein [Planctomycetota bacterium]|nr:DUF2225 domain-containing protein [Planctomycetota bacterium]
MSTPDNIKLTCPCCTHDFESVLIVNYSVGGKDPDFCPQYLGANPLPNFLHVCSECGFCGYEADYRNLKDDAKIKRVNELLAGFHWSKDQELGGAERYRRAALISIYSGRKSAEVADLFLQATWCSRMEGEPDEEQKNARRKAVKYFELALSADEFADSDFPVVHYLIGELSRRLGNAEKAREHFSKLDDLVDVDEWLIKWRDTQLELLNEES